MLLLAAALGAAPANLPAAEQEQVYLFLRNNKIYLRVPDGPEYPASIRSPVYESYAAERVTGCTQDPEIRERTDVLQFYKPRKGGEIGRVHVELLVNPAGRVAAIQVLESAGSLALYSVLNALQGWKFVPGNAEDGQPAWCRFEVAVEFVPPGSATDR
jgi:TonB family protein